MDSYKLKFPIVLIIFNRPDTTERVFEAIRQVVLNFILIPIYGGVGAAIATAISQAFASFISNAFNSQSRKIFRIQLRSFFMLPMIGSQKV